MKVYEAYERRVWRKGCKPTWRRVPAIVARYQRGSAGPSAFALRRITGVRGKLIATGRSA